MSSLFHTTRERRLWLAAAGWLVAIWLSLYPARGAVNFLRSRNVLMTSVLACFLIAGAVVVVWAWRRRLRLSQWAILVVSGSVYATAFAVVRRPEERLHFIEYGVMGILIYAALSERRRSRLAAPARGWTRIFDPVRWPAISAFMLTTLLGWGDEVIQGILPNRYYDLRDLVFNALGGLMAVLTVSALRLDRNEPERVDQ